MKVSARISLVLAVLIAFLAAGPTSAPVNAFAIAPVWEAGHGRPALQTGTQNTTYVVQKGDSLARISARFGVTIDQLVQANALTTTVLQPGQVLIIPVASEQPVANIYSRVSGTAAFIRRVKAALDWLAANDPDAFARVDGY